VPDQNKKAEIEFFDNFVLDRNYDVFNEQGYHKIINEIVKLSNPKDGEKLLDIGCGTGAFTQRLSQINLTTVGIDISYECTKTASKCESNGYFCVGDAEHLPFPNGSFNIVLLSGILHHLPSLVGVMTECFRILSAGGHLVAFDPNGRNPAMWIYRSPTSPIGTRVGWTVNERLLYKEEVESVMKTCGFKQGTAYGIAGVSYSYVKNPLVQKVLWLYNIFDLLLQRSGLARRFGSFLISYGKKPL
jgi:ubiquinone/menaquinone biosynthesis C-methylase UbiE